MLGKLREMNIYFPPIPLNSATARDEMCNFYLMYYMDGGEPLKHIACIFDGPPTYHWKNDQKLRNIPDEDASRLDDGIIDINVTHSAMIEQVYASPVLESRASTIEQAHPSSAEQAHINTCCFFLISLYLAVFYNRNFIRF